MLQQRILFWRRLKKCHRIEPLHHWQILRLKGRTVLIRDDEDEDDEMEEIEIEIYILLNCELL